MKFTPIPNRPGCDDPTEPGILRFEEARDRILQRMEPVRGRQRIPLAEACGRILARPIIADRQVPPHANAAVDGYAFAARDIPSADDIASLNIVGTALAGRPFTDVVTAGQAVRITTGARLPDGCDTVAMQENVEVDGERLRLDGRHRAGDNVRQAGEDIDSGDIVLAAGRRLTPADVGLIASLGIAEIEVVRRLRVALAATGDEIHAIDDPRTEGGIYDSNRYTLGAALRSSGAELLSLGILPDDPEKLLQSFRGTAEAVDVIISSGGVSVGAADYTKDAVGTGGDILFWKVAIKPGRPLAFGKIGNADFFGLPGNPVAAMVTFYQFVRPALEVRMGNKDTPMIPTFRARSLVPIRKKPGRTEFPRGILNQDGEGNWQVRTTGNQGSGILTSMSLANAFIILPHESSDVKVGDWVSVQPFCGFM